MPRPPQNRAHLVRQLQSLGVQMGGVLLVHTSFRAIGPIEGGPVGLIGALRETLGPYGTLVMPSWTDSDDHPFDPCTTPASPDLGVVAEIFWRQPGVLRSHHCFAFAAAGPKARQILADPLPLPPHIPASPVGRVHDLDGQVLLLGVDHSANTTIHLAEIIARVPYGVPKHCTVLENGVAKRIPYRENDHCCERFVLLNAWLGKLGLQYEGIVGHAHSRLMRSRNVVAITCRHLAKDPLLFLHPASAMCEDCDAARDSAIELRSGA